MYETDLLWLFYYSTVFIILRYGDRHTDVRNDIHHGDVKVIHVLLMILRYVFNSIYVILPLVITIKE